MNNLLICKGKSRNSCSFLAFLLFTFLLVAPTAAQTLKENNITLRVQNEPVENVFNKISEQTNFKFIYDQETVNNAPHVSFDVKNATLKQILGVITTQSKFISIGPIIQLLSVNSRLKKKALNVHVPFREWS